MASGKEESISREEKLRNFNPNDPASLNGNLFGLPFTEDESEIVIVPVPWEVTVSYHAGTAKAPAAILEASKQVDLYDIDVPDGWKNGFFLRPVNKKIQKTNKELRQKATRYLELLNPAQKHDKRARKILEEVNRSGEELKQWMYNEAAEILNAKKSVALLGGDHSTPLGFMEALGDHYPEYGILQIDAHCDLRNAYEGFTFSHASIMYNALKIQQVTRLVQVGIRDYCLEEVERIHGSEGRIKAFFDADMKRSVHEGETWKQICDHIIHSLPQYVYISFDIDGLDPKLCPNTGTPVPGGLQFDEAVYLILRVVRSGRKIIGFDLNEVAPGKTDWDANVGARMLFKLCNLMVLSHKMFQKDFRMNETESPINDEEVIIKRSIRESVDSDSEIAD